MRLGHPTSAPDSSRNLWDFGVFLGRLRIFGTSTMENAQLSKKTQTEVSLSLSLSQLSQRRRKEDLISRDEKAVAIDACSLDERRMFSMCSTDAFTQTDVHHESAAVDIDAIEFLTIYPWQVCDKCGSRLPHAIQKHEDMIGDIIQHCGCCSQNMKNNGCTARKELYPDSIQISSQADAETLRIITMEFQWQHVRGGQASVTSRQKKNVARAIWKIIFASTHEVFFCMVLRMGDHVS